MIYALLLAVIAIISFRIALILLIGIEQQRLKKEGFPTSRAELNVWTTPPSDVVDRTRRLSEVVSEIEDRIENDRSNEELDKLFRRAMERAIDSDNHLAETWSIAEEIAREENIPMERREVAIDVEIPLNQIPLATNIVEPIRYCVSQCVPHVAPLFAVLGEGKCQFTYDFRPWPDVDLITEPSKLRTTAKLIQRHAIVSSDAGKIDEAVRYLDACFRLAAVLIDEPTMMSQLVRIAVVTIGIEGVEQVLSRSALTLSQLEQLESGIASADRDDAFVRASVGEICLVAGGAGGLHTERPEWKKARIWKQKPEWWSWRLFYELPLEMIGLEKLRNLAYIVLSRRYIATLREPDESIAFATFRYFSLIRKVPRFVSPSTPGTIIGSPNLAPMQFRSRMSAFRAAFAVEKFRIAHGRLPEDATELIPAFLKNIPIMPLDGEPFVIVFAGRGYAIGNLPNKEEQGSESEQSLVKSGGFRVLR